jgi:predicted dehydrogenase
MNLSAVLWYDKDRMASFDCGFDVVMRQWFEIAGTKASMVCDDFVLPGSTAEARYFVHGAEGTKRKEFVVRDCDQIVAMIEDFTKAVQSGKLNAAWPRETLETMRVLEAVEKSAKTGSRVQL